MPPKLCLHQAHGFTRARLFADNRKRLKLAKKHAHTHDTLAHTLWGSRVSRWADPFSTFYLLFSIFHTFWPFQLAEKAGVRPVARCAIDKLKTDDKRKLFISSGSGPLPASTPKDSERRRRQRLRHSQGSGSARKAASCTNGTRSGLS